MPRILRIAGDQPGQIDGQEAGAADGAGAAKTSSDSVSTKIGSRPWSRLSRSTSRTMANAAEQCRLTAPSPI